MTQLLVVDDEPQFRNSLLKALKSQGYRASGIPTTDLLTSTVAVERPDVILLDLCFENGDGEDGLAACERLRRWSAVPVVVLSVRDDEATKVKALRVGADDYLVKPFGIQELLARIQAIQRRLMPRLSSQHPVVQVRELTINLDTRSVLLGGEVIDLTKQEYRLLEILARAQGELVTYKVLLHGLWPDELADSDRASSIRALVKRLRQKLGDNLSNEGYVLTQPGMGFRLNMNPSSLMVNHNPSVCLPVG